MSELISSRDAFGKALIEVGKENKDVVVLTADLAEATRTYLFAKEFPKRFFNFGIAEQNMIATAAGFATSGKIPVVATFAIFAAGLAWEVIRLTIGYTGLNVKIVGTHAGLGPSLDGPSHQMNEDIALMRAIPNMVVLVPSDAIETEKTLKAAIDYSGPVYLRISRTPIPVFNTPDYQFQIGKAIVLRKGEDITIISCGIMVSRVLESAERLSKKGIEAEVINLPTLKPLDEESLLSSASKTKRVLTVEEHSLIGGLGNTVAMTLLGRVKDISFQSIGIPDCFGETGETEKVFSKFGLTVENIVDTAKKMIS